MTTINTAEIEARPVFEFDRYVDGKLRAEGIKISGQNDLAGAIREASRLADAGDVLVLRSDAFKAETARADRYAERLEITAHWVSHDDGVTLTRVEVPREDWDTQIDGIDCRDETIKLQDEAVGKLRTQLTAANEKLAAARELVRKLGDPLLEICDHLVDEGDRVYLGSTNHADTLKDVQQSYWLWWLQEEIDAGRCNPEANTGDGNGRT